MFQRVLCLGVGALALLAVLGAPGRVHAQHMRGGGPRMVRPSSRGGMMTPGFRGGFDHRFGRRFDSRFDRSFDRFEDRFENRSNRGIFSAPSFVPGFGPTFMRPF